MTAPAMSLNSLALPGSGDAALRPNRAETFSQLLRGSPGAEEVRTAAMQLVSSALIEPVLNSLHDSPFLEGPFAPGDAERRFAPMFDQMLADRITGAANFPLIDLIVERYGPRGSTNAPNEKGGIDVKA